MDMMCLGEMDDRASPESYRKVGRGHHEPYEPNQDANSLRRDYDFRLVDVEIPEEYRRGFIEYQD